MRSTQHESSTSNLKDDVAVLEDVIAVCEDGRKLYQQVAVQATDPQSSSFFAQLAEVRAQIVCELTDNAPQGTTTESAVGTAVRNFKRWYADATTRFHRDEAALIEQIETNEKHFLATLKQAVKKLNDKTLAQRLASQTASFQIALDQMRFLKESHTHR